MASKFEKITIGNCILVNADCYDVLPTLPEKFVSLVNTDPPYVVKTSKKQLGKIGNHTETRLGATFERLSSYGISNGYDEEKFFELTKRILKYEANYQIWCSKKQFYPLLQRAESNKWGWQDIHLFRTNYLPTINHKYADSDYCVHMWKGRSVSGKYENKQTGYFWKIGKKPPELNHPTLKPLEPMLNLIETGSDKGDVVLDPFMGSGTCGVACIQTGRKFIGIEKNKEFFEMAVARIRKEIEKKS